MVISANLLQSSNIDTCIFEGHKMRVGLSSWRLLTFFIAVIALAPLFTTMTSAETIDQQLRTIGSVTGVLVACSTGVEKEQLVTKVKELVTKPELKEAGVTGYFVEGFKKGTLELSMIIDGAWIQVNCENLESSGQLSNMRQSTSAMLDQFLAIK